MLNGCSWIKNFQLLSARWRRTREGEIGAAVKKKQQKKQGGGGASAACLRPYISPGFGNQTQEKPTASKHTLGASHALPIFRQRKHSMMILPHLFMFFSFFSFFFFSPVRGGGRYLDLPGQLAERGEVCTARSIRLHIISRQFGAPDPGFRRRITANFCWMLMRSEILRQSNIS